MPDRDISKLGELYRHFELNRAQVDEEARTVPLAFSSEEPYERWFGSEILDHSPQSIRLGRLMNGGPLLLDHDPRRHIGTIESVELSPDRVGRAVVRFGRSPEAEAVFQDVKDGIRKHVSVGYIVHKMVMQESSADAEVYRVTDWEPLEVSLVAIPADPTVGVGRAATLDITTVIDRPEPKKEHRTMTTTVDTPNTAEIEARAAADVQKRVSDMIALGEAYTRFGGDKLAAEYIRAGKGIDALREAIMQKMANTGTPTDNADIGLTEEEARDFSFVRAIHAMSTGNWKQAGFERECSLAVAQRMGKDPQGIFVPLDVQRRDLTVGTPTAGGNLVPTELMSGDFISLLRSKMALIQAGATFLPGLQGNIAIPRQTGGATAYWVTEGSSPTESQQAFDQVQMSPKTVGAFTDISRKLLLQSSLSIEAFVRNDLATVVALALDLAGINGSGTGSEPRGVLKQVGIGAVLGGTNGGAPTWQNIIDLESAVANVNADIGTLGYLTNTKVRGKIKGTEKSASTGQYIWQDGDAPLNGYRATISNQVPGNLTKGTAAGICSAILFGNFADLLIGQWGALDLMVDPYTNSTSGTVRVVALQDADIAVRHVESFAAMVDALTA